jgi:hypothetical protein
MLLEVIGAFAAILASVSLVLQPAPWRRYRNVASAASTAPGGLICSQCHLTLPLVAKEADKQQLLHRVQCTASTQPAQVPNKAALTAVAGAALLMQRQVPLAATELAAVAMLD